MYVSNMSLTSNEIQDFCESCWREIEAFAKTAPEPKP
jgi:hypothetical protein